MSVSVRGADDFADLAARIRRHADRKSLQKELYAGLNRATKDLREGMKQTLATELDAGDAAAVLSAQLGLQARGRGGREAGIRIITSRKHDYRSLNEGKLRHPVFGNRSVWVSQPVRPRLLEHRFEDEKPEIRRAIKRVMDEVARKVEG